jgi:class 3 adenylate cyclase
MHADEYFAVFRRPSDALMAAARIQLGLAKHEWSAGALRLRIGLHTGRPTVADAAYVGIVVHTLARVCSAGHGGQILLSSATHAALAGAAVAGLRYRALGMYRLAGLQDPELLYQVEGEGLIPDFPKLRVKPFLPRPAIGRVASLSTA